MKQGHPGLSPAIHLRAGPLIFAALLYPMTASGQAPFEDVLTTHLERYPRMQLQDLYKLVHQAALGSEHAVDDAASARAWLSGEIETLGEGPDEPKLDPLLPDSGVVRVHLRPWIASGGNTDSLLSAFVMTANSYAGSGNLLLQLWGVATELAATSRLPFDPTEMGDFIREMEESRFPAMRHSDLYEELYRPAYRVVALRFLSPKPRP